MEKNNKVRIIIDHMITAIFGSQYTIYKEINSFLKIGFLLIKLN